MNSCGYMVQVLNTTFARRLIDTISHNQWDGPQTQILYMYSLGCSPVESAPEGSRSSGRRPGSMQNRVRVDLCVTPDADFGHWSNAAPSDCMPFHGPCRYIPKHPLPVLTTSVPAAVYEKRCEMEADATVHD